MQRVTGRPFTEAATSAETGRLHPVNEVSAIATHAPAVLNHRQPPFLFIPID